MYSTASNLNAFLKQETRTLLVLDQAHNFPVQKLVTSNVGFNCWTIIKDAEKLKIPIGDLSGFRHILVSGSLVCKNIIVKNTFLFRKVVILIFSANFSYPSSVSMYVTFQSSTVMKCAYRFENAWNLLQFVLTFITRVGFSFSKEWTLNYLNKKIRWLEQKGKFDVEHIKKNKICLIKIRLSCIKKNK